MKRILIVAIGFVVSTIGILAIFAGCSPKKEVGGFGDAAEKVYVAPGSYDEFYAFMSGGFSGQVSVYGLPSGRLFRVIPVFSVDPEKGYGYSEETKPLLMTSHGFVPWDDAHHPQLSVTDGQSDGRWLFINGNNTPRIARMDLTTFETVETIEIPNSGGNHGSPFLTPNNEYVVASTRFSVPIPQQDVSITSFKENFKGTISFISVDSVTGRMKIAFQILVPGINYDLSRSGKGPSHGWSFFSSYNSEQANTQLEVNASKNDKDFIAAINWKLAEELIAQGKAGLADIPESALVKKDGSTGVQNQRQLLQLRNTSANIEWIDPALREILDSFAYPLHFIDFETSALAVPYHAGMHPYENVAFQWSCHTLRSPYAEPEHAEWINLEQAFPSFAFAESLMKHLGMQGTFFMWATHENTILKEIRRQMEGRSDNDRVKDWLDWITNDGNGKTRLVDMNNLTLRHYFHPIMGGKTSIKKVLDAIWKSNPALHERFPTYVKKEGGEILSPYKSLPPLIMDGEDALVAEGTGAIRAYQAMLYGPQKSDLSIRAIWKKLLLQYCELDTSAMVMVYLHWRQLLSVV